MIPSQPLFPEEDGGDDSIALVVEKQMSSNSERGVCIGFVRFRVTLGN
jgi:hypothetical protein